MTLNIKPDSLKLIKISLKIKPQGNDDWFFTKPGLFSSFCFATGMISMLIEYAMIDKDF